ncbi:hypothetical protein INR49_019539 [Caranx melampygus]|nr:hypothetical protein INR49_019539 [Caranx melampygus]
MLQPNQHSQRHCRETSGNMGQGVEEDWTAESSHEESIVDDEAAAGPSGELWSGGAGPSAGVCEGARTGKRKRGRMNEERDRREKVIEELLIQSLQRPPALLPPPPPPPPAWIEEERFLSSLAPSLHRLPPQQREYVKYHIHKLIYESTTITLNLDLLE